MMVVEIMVMGTVIATSVRVSMMDDGKDSGGEGDGGTVKVVIMKTGNNCGHGYADINDGSGGSDGSDGGNANDGGDGASGPDGSNGDDVILVTMGAWWHMAMVIVIVGGLGHCDDGGCEKVGGLVIVMMMAVAGGGGSDGDVSMVRYWW